MKNLVRYFLLALLVASPVFAQIDSLSIAQAREDLNNDLIPDRLGDTVIVVGTVYSPNYQTTNRSYYICDNTAGIVTFGAATVHPLLNAGDRIRIRGKVGQYNGLTQLQPIDLADVIVLSSGNPMPAPIVLTLAQFKANPELYESRLVAILNVNKASGTWPAVGASATIKVYNGTDTTDMRIDSDTEIDGTTEPGWPLDFVGCASQFSSVGSLSNGYQVLPRYMTDFYPPNTLPVELSLFTATSVGNIVNLNWETASETNNKGFEVQRSLDNINFSTLSFLNGNASTTITSKYNFTDVLSTSSKVYYRLRQMDYDGSFTFTNTVEVDVTLLTGFALTQNFPNPFNPSTTISFTVAEEGVANLSVYSTSGELVASLFNETAKSGQNYNIHFNASNLPSGIYFYKLTQGSNIVTKKLTLLK